MMQTSTAYILVKSLGYKYSFDGVTSISHALSLKISTDSESQTEGDYINNARNEPDVVTLSVVASDANVPVLGWSRQTMTSLCQIKEYRLLCKVITNLRVYDNMLLSAISVQQDDSCPDGWTGTLTFTYAGQSGGTAGSSPSYDNSSTPVSTGSTAVRSAGSASGSVLQTILREAGIRI